MGNQALGQEQFLKLLLTQLEHQDPLNPMEAREFTAQLAQFSLLEQAMQTNKALDQLKLHQESANNIQVLGLIGKEVRARGNSLNVDTSSVSSLNFDLAGSSIQTEAYIYDASGRLVRTVELGSKEKGTHTYQWDGRDHLGHTLPDGTYTFEVVGKGKDGNRVDAELSLLGRVEAVKIGEQGAYLVVNGVNLYLRDVLEVRG
jgi:flagellar basal-body rod modification protein FlgD